MPAATAQRSKVQAQIMFEIGAGMFSASTWE